MKFKDLVKQITEMVENRENHLYKENAYKELSRVDLSKKPSVRFILEDYPDFDHIQFKISQPGRFVVKICINYDDLKDNPKAIKQCAKMVYKFAKNKETL